MTTERIRPFSFFLASLLLSAGVLCQGRPTLSPPPPAKKAPQKRNPTSTRRSETEGKKKAPKWPHLKFARRNLVKEKISDLVSKKASKRTMVEKLILRYGVGVAPVLMGAMNDRQKPSIVRRLTYFLDKLLSKEYAPLLIKEYQPKNRVLSLYLVRKLASFNDKQLIPFFKKATRNPYPEISETANLALASLGDVSSLPSLVKLARDNWQNENRKIREAAIGLRGKSASDILVPMLRKADDDLKIGILRILAVVGTKKTVSTVASLLDSQKHQVRVAAVNALRGILDGAPPYANLSVFSAIEEVKKWKRRVH